MNHSDIVFLSGIAWLIAGFFIGYRYHVLKVREIQARRTKLVAQELRDCELDRLVAKVAVESLEQDISTFGERVVCVPPLQEARN